SRKGESMKNKRRNTWSIADQDFHSRRFPLRIVLDAPPRPAARRFSAAQRSKSGPVKVLATRIARHASARQSRWTKATVGGAIVAETGAYLFVGPDNGVLSWALAQEQVKGVRALEEPQFFLGSVSQTFHGRDVFAPVAAHLSNGLGIHRLGSTVKDWMRLAWL